MTSRDQFQLEFDFEVASKVVSPDRSPNWLNEAVASYESGRTASEVAQSIGVSDYLVLKWLRREGTQIRGGGGRRHPPDLRQQLVDKYKSGRSMRSISLETGIRDVTIRSWLDASGVPLRPRSSEISAIVTWSVDTVAAWAHDHQAGISITAIAATHKTTKSTVSKLLRHHGHKVRRAGAPAKTPIPPKAELAANYEESGSMEKIASEHSVSVWVVQRWMREYGLEVGGRGSTPVTNEEFFAERTPVRPKDGCWLWHGSLTPPGYGKAMWREEGQTSVMGAHKMAHLLYCGAVPDGMVVRHLCHRRRCCRPDHLEVGTHQDNADDRVNAGREAKHRNRNARRDQHRDNESRLKSRIEKDDETDCWNWRGGGKATGYGVMVWNPRRQGEPRSITTHRAAYLLYRGEIPEGELVRHLCNNKACCNPDHLELGSVADNVQDEVDAGRTRKGVDHHRTTLVGAEVVRMRELRATGWLHRDLAAEFGVSMGAVAAITTGRTWAHVGGPITAPATGTGSGNPTARLTEDKVRRIRSEVESKSATHQALADEFGVTAGTIAHIVHRRTWRDVE